MVYDKDTLGKDDPMGTAEIDFKPYVEAARLRKELQELPNGCALKKVQPSGTNDLADESIILWEKGRITQDMRLKLRNVESGEVLIQIEWVDIPGCKGLDPDYWIFMYGFNYIYCSLYFSYTSSGNHQFSFLIITVWEYENQTVIQLLCYNAE